MYNSRQCFISCLVLQITIISLNPFLMKSVCISEIELRMAVLNLKKNIKILIPKFYIIDVCLLFYRCIL